MAESTEEVKAAPVSVQIEDAGPARKSLTIEVPAERIADKLEESMDQLGNEAAVPGFRKGRVPRKLIERRFGSSIRDDVRAQLISEAYTEAVEENKLEVLGEPDVKDADDIELPEDGPMTFKVDIEVVPDVTLPDFSSLKVDKVKFEVKDEDVQQEVDGLCDRLGQVEAVGDGEIQEKDYAQSQVTILEGEDAKDDAEQIAQHTGVYILVNGKSADYKGHVVGIVVDDLGKKLSGKKVGDEVRVSMTGPAQHEDDKIREQPITIVIKIENIERIAPAKIETVIERMGVESEDDLKKRIRESVEERNQRRQQSEMYDQIRSQIVEMVDIELPEKMTGRQVARTLRQQAMELAYRGVPEEQIEQQIAEARGGSEDEAKRSLKLFFILDKAARELEVNVDDGEMNGRIAMIAMQQGRRPEKVRQEMQRSGEIESLYLSIREQHTLDKILEKAKVTETDKPAEDSGEKAEKKKTTKKKKSSKKKTTAKKAEDAE